MAPTVTVEAEESAPSRPARAAAIRRRISSKETVSPLVVLVTVPLEEKMVELNPFVPLVAGEVSLIVPAFPVEVSVVAPEVASVVVVVLVLVAVLVGVAVVVAMGIEETTSSWQRPNED